jgi:hypothetical protein
MRVKLDTQLIYFGREYEPGDEVELPDLEARRFIERGLAVECAAISPPEQATEPIARKRDVRNTTARPKSRVGH